MTPTREKLLTDAVIDACVEYFLPTSDEDECAILKRLGEQAKLPNHESRHESAGWIPVSERLPERFTDVIVAAEIVADHIVTVQNTLAWDGRRWTFGAGAYGYDGKVIAWRPLPAPPHPPRAPEGNRERAPRSLCRDPRR